MEAEHVLRDFGLILGAGLVALAVCATLLLQATTAGYAARRLDLREEPEASG